MHDGCSLLGMLAAGARLKVLRRLYNCDNYWGSAGSSALGQSLVRTMTMWQLAQEQVPQRTVRGFT